MRRKQACFAAKVCFFLQIKKKQDFLMQKQKKTCYYSHRIAASFLCMNAYEF